MKVSIKNGIRKVTQTSKKPVSVYEVVRQWREKYGGKLKNWDDVAEIRRWREHKS